MTSRRWHVITAPPLPRGRSAAEVVDEKARDAVARREPGQARAGEPAGVLQLLRIDPDLAPRVGGDEADHELAREGPVLAPDVGDVLHLHADLFLHLSRDRALERLAVVDEAGDERVAVGRPHGLAREQHAVAVAHDDDDRRVQVGIVLVRAARAALAPFPGEALGAVAAAGTEAARRLPPEGLHGHAAEREEVVGQARALHRHERFPLELLRHGGVPRQRRDPALGGAERPQPERLAEHAVELRRALARGQPEALALPDDDQVLVLDDEPVAALVRRLHAALGRNEGAAQAIAVEGEIDGERRGHEPRSPTSTGAPARNAAEARPEAGASAPSFWRAGITSRAKRRMFRSASSSQNVQPAETGGGASAPFTSR